MTNQVVEENKKSDGVDEHGKLDWDIEPKSTSALRGNEDIQGFAEQMSVNRGNKIKFKVHAPAAIHGEGQSFSVDIYRLGYYNGKGARCVRRGIRPNESSVLSQDPNSAVVDPATGLQDFGNWQCNAEWDGIDETSGDDSYAISGVYIARLQYDKFPRAFSHIPFIVRDDAKCSDLLFQTSDMTWQAYNCYGSHWLYPNEPLNPKAFGWQFEDAEIRERWGRRVHAVSYNRPFTTRGDPGAKTEGLFHAEYPMLYWLEANGYDVQYCSGIDVHREGENFNQGVDWIKKHKVFMSVGHDEYVSAEQRGLLEAARDAGVHLAFFSGNEMFWRVMLTKSIDCSAIPHRTLICRKESLDRGTGGDFTTGLWRDPRSKDGGCPENGLTGTLGIVSDTNDKTMDVSLEHSRLWFWRNTDVAKRGGTGIAALPFGIVGYEWDEDVNNKARPEGLIRLSSTTRSVTRRLEYDDDPRGIEGRKATHSLTLYRHQKSRALVFGAGTVQWSWGLTAPDVHDAHDCGRGRWACENQTVKQATVNLLADMGVQPGTIKDGLYPAMASVDKVAPTSTITFPQEGTTVALGDEITVRGISQDRGDAAPGRPGVVAAVEVSTDGVKWNPAVGREQWSYVWKPNELGQVTLYCRAIDDSCNVEVKELSATGIRLRVISRHS